MDLLPDVILIGQFPLAVGALTGLLGAALAYLLAGWLARREGADPGPAQDVVLNLLIGGLAGAKLIYVVLNPAAHLANPLSLLIFPYGPLALPAAAGAGALAVAWGLRREPDRLSVLDRTLAAVAPGFSLAALGLKGPGMWAFAPFLGVAGVGAILTAVAWRGEAPGHRASAALVMVAAALVLADMARPNLAAAEGLSGLQLAAAVVGTAAWFWTRRKA